jgi:hypothetical protein
MYGEAVVADVERHHCVTVGGDHLGAGLDEVGVCLNYPVGAVEQGERRPLGLPEWCADTHELATHAAVEHREFVHLVSLPAGVWR